MGGTPVCIATLQAQSAVQFQPSPPATGQTTEFQPLSAAAAAAALTKKMTTGTTFPIVLQVVFLNDDIKGKPEMLKRREKFNTYLTHSC